MAAEVRPTPWNILSPSETGYSGYRRQTALGRAAQGIEYSLKGGYRPAQPYKQPVFHEIRRGHKVYKVRYEDYDEFIGFSNVGRSLGTDEQDDKIVDYVDTAKYNHDFARDHGRQIAGHIGNIKYSSSRQLLVAEFTGTSDDGVENNGAVVVFFRVPNTLYFTLEHLGDIGSGSRDRRGVFRHDIGKEFWRLVRITGQRTGSRYDYRYTHEGTSSGGAIRTGAGYEGGLKIGGDAWIKQAAAKLSPSLKAEYERKKTRNEKELFLELHGFGSGQQTKEEDYSDLQANVNKYGYEE